MHPSRSTRRRRSTDCSARCRWRCRALPPTGRWSCCSTTASSSIVRRSRSSNISSATVRTRGCWPSAQRGSRVAEHAPWGELLARLDAHHTCAKISLSGLTVSDVVAVVPDHVGGHDEIARRLCIHTGGNPRFVHELLANGAPLPDDDATWPAVVQDVFARRLAAASPSTQRLLAAGGIVGIALRHRYGDDARGHRARCCRRRVRRSVRPRGRRGGRGVGHAILRRRGASGEHRADRSHRASRHARSGRLPAHRERQRRGRRHVLPRGHGRRRRRGGDVGTASRRRGHAAARLR